jgi:tRNA-splicing ligase RtcB
MISINSQGKPIFSWCNNLEGEAIDQARNLANLPFLYKWVSLMPDCHAGFGMPIGGVIACDNVVIPNSVGVDIGCGMRVMQTLIRRRDITDDLLVQLVSEIRKRIPIGKGGSHSVCQKSTLLDQAPKIPIVMQELKTAYKQLGTLGSGNHFIEIQEDSRGYVWVMIHSGSRNFGYSIARYYNEVAKELCQKWHIVGIPINGEDGLAYLPANSVEGLEYIKAMEFAMEFARSNRLAMMYCILECMRDIGLDFAILELVIHDVHHNYAAIECHYGKNVWVHRKGAISAKKDEVGIIPGSQGTYSYIVRGLGNPKSFMSCSHGAGRKMSRSKAKELLNLKEEARKLDKLGILHNLKNQSDLDEASGAYKDIDIVMEEQKDLVEIVEILKPIAVIKG